MKLKKQAWCETVKMVELVIAYGCELPASVQGAITRKYAESLMDLERWDDLAKCLMPWANGEPAAEEWQSSDPMLPYALDTEDEATLASFREHFLGGVFNDSLMRMVMNVTGNVAGARGALLKLSHALLSRFATYQAVSDAEVPEQMDFINQLVMACRGFSALLFAEPMAYSASCSDVDFLRDVTKKNGPSRMDSIHMPATRAISAHLRESPVWKQLYTDYLKLAAVELKSAPEFNRMWSTLRATERDEAFSDRLAVYADTVDKILSTKEELRPGAHDNMEATILQRIVAEADALESSTGFWSNSDLPSKTRALGQLRDVAMRSTADSATAVVQGFNDKLAEWKKQNSNAALAMLAGAPMSSRGDVEPLKDALLATNAEDNQLDPAVATLLADMRDLVIQRMADDVIHTATGGANSTTMLIYTGTLDLLHKLTVVNDLLGGDNDKNNRAAPVDIANHCMEVRIALALLTKSDRQAAAAIVVALDSAVKAHDSLTAAMTKWQKPANPKLSDNINRIVKEMIEAAKSVHADLATAIGDRCSLAVSASHKYLKAKCDAAAEVAGGHPSEQASWHASLKGAASMNMEAIVSLGEKTVLKAKGDYIDACKKRLGEAIADYELVRHRYKPFRLSLPFDDALLAKAKATKEQCEITKFEALVLRAWISTQEKTAEERHAAIEAKFKKFTSAGLDCKLVQKGLWKAAQSAMGKSSMVAAA